MVPPVKVTVPGQRAALRPFITARLADTTFGERIAGYEYVMSPPCLALRTDRGAPSRRAAPHR